MQFRQCRGAVSTWPGSSCDAYQMCCRCPQHFGCSREPGELPSLPLNHRPHRSRHPNRGTGMAVAEVGAAAAVVVGSLAQAHQRLARYPLVLLHCRRLWAQLQPPQRRTLDLCCCWRQHAPGAGPCWPRRWSPRRQGRPSSGATRRRRRRPPRHPPEAVSVMEFEKAAPLPFESGLEFLVSRSTPKWVGGGLTLTSGLTVLNKLYEHS